MDTYLMSVIISFVLTVVIVAFVLVNVVLVV